MQIAYELRLLRLQQFFVSQCCRRHEDVTGASFWLVSRLGRVDPLLNTLQRRTRRNRSEQAGGRGMPKEDSTEMDKQREPLATVLSRNQLTKHWWDSIRVGYDRNATDP